MNKLLYFLFCISFSTVLAQNSERIYKSVEFIEQQRLNIKVSDGIYKIIPYTKNIIETTFIPTGEIEKKTSHAVVLKPKQIDVTFVEKVDHFVLQTDGILVKV